MPCSVVKQVRLIGPVADWIATGAMNLHIAHPTLLRAVARRSLGTAWEDLDGYMISDRTHGFVGGEFSEQRMIGHVTLMSLSLSCTYYVTGK